MVTTFYPPYHFGGDASYVRSLAHALARQGHHVTVIHDCDAFHMVRGNAEPAPLEEPPGVVVHGMRSRLGALSCLATHQTGRPVVHGARIAEILSGDFDVIHYHNISLVGGPGVLTYGNALKIYTAHEHWLVCPTHILWRHNREICTGKQCLSCSLRYRRPPQPWRTGSFLESCANHVDAFTTLSQSCVDRHREFGFDHPMQVVPPFLSEPAPEEPTGELPKATRPYCLFVGRLEATKGLQDVIPMFDDDSASELWIAGAGSYEGELRRLAAGRKAVRFLGFQRFAELQRLYQGARVVVMPSLCYEVFPMVILEAFREGAPIIARRRGPFPEIIEGSGGGLLFDTQEELRDAIDKVVGDDALRAELSRHAVEAFHLNWTEAAGLGRYFGLIEKLARRRGIHDLAPARSQTATA